MVLQHKFSLHFAQAGGLFSSMQEFWATADEMFTMYVAHASARCVMEQCDLISFSD